MFTFKAEQRIFDIGSVKLGGQPGQLPTVLIGSIFHRGHRIVEDSKRGLFDKDRAKRLIFVQQELSEKTGNPHMIDVVGETSEALIRYMEFISEVTEAPFLPNGPDATIRLEAVRYVASVGLLERMVYNSINYTATEQEFVALKGYHVKAAIVQAFNPRNPQIDGMRQQLLGYKGKEGLLERAFKAGIEKPLILTPVLDIPSIGVAVGAIFTLKNELGLPTGAAPLGVISTWKRSGEDKEFSKRLGKVAAATLTQCMGANFLIYGSIGKARNIFPSCALIDAIIAYSMAAIGVKPLTRNHPLYKIL
ncbi:tetrahydromethanopterin S-methyltransferase subunit H [Candidatus Bathyarchaeota archaeon]|nr:tetrahydromethanopterin S-methyltransferase subunit H [Candidatus Bathyarchaeota archaeon]MBS7628284.1 tetrahydromethanopterin S-methyltransferase subunit H [Candidatus Bathyarchaeota archaeon]